MFFNVLSIVFVIWMHLTHFAQHQTTRRLVTHDMAALAVGGSALGDFDHERSAGIFEMLSQRTRRSRTEIVGIRDEQILESMFLEHVEQPGFPDG